jgi:hypothetical protein
MNTQTIYLRGAARRVRIPSRSNGVRAYFISAVLFVAATSAQALVAQQIGENVAQQRPFCVSLTDPACPVTGASDPVPNTKELHVLYFANARGATIKDPGSLSLHIVFEYGLISGDRKTLPFVRRDDDVWMAAVPLQDRIPQYAVYWVEDGDTKQSDTNHGKYFDVRFCDVHGERSELGVKWEAQVLHGSVNSLRHRPPSRFRRGD